MLRIGFIGDGGIARCTRAALDESFITSAALVRQARSPGDVETLSDLLAAKPHIIVECAGHDAVRSYATDILDADVSLLVISVGALADRDLFDRIEAAQAGSAGRLLLPAGAIGGMDALAAARLGGLSWVRYRARKPASAWKGTAAETRAPLDALTEATSFFKGTAREAALLFPKNSNVAATVALSGIGFDRTEVELVAEPDGNRNIHEISFSGGDGFCRFEIEGVPSPDNPKTSMLTAHSVARALIEFDQSRNPA